MEQFLTSSVFKYVLFPLSSVGLGIAVKFVSRNDQYARFSKEDIAVGLELVLTAGLMFVVLTTDRGMELMRASEELQKLSSNEGLDAWRLSVLQQRMEVLARQLTMAGWVIAGMLLGLWSLSTVVRKWGWRSATEMHPYLGIAVPLAAGILSLVAVMAGAGK